MRTVDPRTSRLIRLGTEFADQSTPDSSDEFVIPDTFDDFNDEQLDALHAEAMEHFDALYGDGSDLEDEPLAALAELTKGIEAISTEQAARREAAAERQAAAAELLARVRPEPAEETPSAEDEGAEAEEPAEAETPAAEPGAEVEEREPALVASAEEPVAPKRGTTRIPMSSVRARSSAPAATPSADEGAASIRDALLASGEGLGVAVGTGVDWLEAGELLDRRLNTYNRGLYEHAHASGRAVREQGALLSIKRDIPDDLVVKNSNPEHVESVLQRAVDERQLVGGSLVASGGWCAPSETLYDLIELESSDGLLSLPEIGIARGGVSFTRGPSFADVFSQMTGFSFTEAQDIAGEYAPNEMPGEANVVGDKPCVRIECPEFEEYRLDVDGLCITGGLLGLKGYPELYARVLRGAQVAHRHRLNGKQIAEMVAGSTAVTMGAKEGTTAPLLDAIEMQVEHYRYSHRLSRGTTLEAVFPYWVRGAVRSDLSRRLGVELLAVTDAQIGSWFALRGVSPQFVYNWQTIDGSTADEFTAWPTEVSFLLYAAGTWIRGASDIITMDSLYDSTLLAQNDFTALFTEEGWFVAKRGHDSRVVTVGISADGATHIGVDIAHDGSIAEAGA